MDQVIGLIKSGQLKFSQGTTAASTAPAGTTTTTTTADPSVTLPKRN